LQGGVKMEPVLLDKDGPVAWLTLNRPEKRNALSLELMTNDKNSLFESG
jgi:enoyl-CoA hydratase/carnithine racemase